MESWWSTNGGRFCSPTLPLKLFWGRATGCKVAPSAFRSLPGDNFAELDHVASDGERIVIEMHVGRTSWSGLDAYVVTVRDITDRKAVERRLEESEQRYALSAKGADDGLWD